jgi:L-rhamnose mutarotase
VGVDRADNADSFEFHTYLAPGMGPAYEEFHRAIPADLDTVMRAAGVLGWRIYRNGETLTHRVDAVDRGRMDRILDADPVNQRWQREVAPFLVQDPATEDDHDPGELVWDFSWPTRASHLENSLFALWIVPPDQHGDAEAAFRQVYADPVLINGTPMAVADLVARAASLHAAFTDHDIEVVDRVSAPGKLTVAFRHRARHTGPWVTPLGELAPSGQTVNGLGIDVLTVGDDGRVTAIWVLADELQRILQMREG